MTPETDFHMSGSLWILTVPGGFHIYKSSSSKLKVPIFPPTLTITL